MKHIKTLTCLITMYALNTVAQPVFTEIICNKNGASNPQDITAFNGKTYFSAGNDSIGREIWETDGSQPGTKLLKDIRSGSNSSYPNTFTVYNNKLYFFAQNAAQNGFDLWVSDGSTSGTVMIHTLGGQANWPEWTIVFGNRLYFTINDTLSISRLWVSDGSTAGTHPLTAYNNGNGCNNPNALIEFKGKLYFSAMNPAYGRELWVSNGTDTGTRMFKDIYAGTMGSSPMGYIEMNNKLYFSAKTATNGTELWESDGSPNGTLLVKDINPGVEDGNPGEFAVFNGKLYFQAAGNSTQREELWVSDGSATGTQLLKEINSAFASYPRFLTVFKNKLYFRANNYSNGDELWVSDGSSSGTRMLKDLNTGIKQSNIFAFTVYNGKLYFTATADPNFAEYSIFETDGTDTGTRAIAPAAKTHTAPFDYQNFFDGFKICNGALFFTAWYTTEGIELWTLKTTAPVTALHTKTHTELIIYPNPAADCIHIDLLNTEADAISITDVFGQILISKTIEAGETGCTLELNGFKTGFYILNIKTKDGIYSQTIVKNH